MNRRDFFKEMAGSLTETFKEILLPFIERDIEKLDRVAETFSGYQFYPVPYSSGGELFQEVVVQSEPVIVLQKDDKLHALSKKCPECSHLLHYLVYQPVFKCFTCDREYNLASHQSFTLFAAKMKQGVLYIGIPRKR
ncbi:hypothetical protein GC093_08455 [Paenibacillus sp. LMG 31456]|uniref:Uncharacterized protein n=1 Tax=Paenibacillus foliorum TaxID=2654974 RepID=A0A972K0V0_9BACL|nr:hypothetical protein [Paenibacillus foliorum]NOU93248.1 hypothetical protein [Paenibacillus foliorum]